MVNSQNRECSELIVGRKFLTMGGVTMIKFSFEIKLKAYLSRIGSPIIRN